MSSITRIPPQLPGRTLLELGIRTERHVVHIRRCARQIAQRLGFGTQDQTRMATAVSEVARNAFMYGGGGSIEFRLEGTKLPQMFRIVVSDQGPGIKNLAEVLSGRYSSDRGMGIGLTGTKQLMDDFHIHTEPQRGTTVSMGRTLPKRRPLVTGPELAEITREMAQLSPDSSLDELQRQNKELLHVLGDLEARQKELATANRELDDTNRGILALNEELDEKMETLRRADELKSKFLSNMSHEFRSPLNSILALSRLLLERMDGELNAEQERQVELISNSCNDLMVLVNDLLDLAKIESGKTEVKVSEFDLNDLLSALRGMMRPLATNDEVDLIVEDPGAIPPLRTDEGKVSQILKNLISNALKFTESGEVRVRTEMVDDETAVAFAVQDTGIGIPVELQESIFQEFTQVTGSFQARATGTGLGLPLARRLAELLGGSLNVVSEPGKGSTFTAVIPIAYGQTRAVPAPMPSNNTILLVDDEEVCRYLLRGLVQKTSYSLVEAENGVMGLEMAKKLKPRAIILDLMMPGMDGYEMLEKLRADPVTRDVPVVVNSSKLLNEQDTDRLEEARAAFLAKPNTSGDRVLNSLQEAAEKVGAEWG
ncbi:MAG: ATP-binding protein, partial [Planctomycetota bacterium]|nr:ATP-binding protein [Planctomycetota bacterium]